MEEKHFINFIDFYVDKVFVKRASLTPALYAAACAHLKVPGKTVTVVERCNIHGWWMTEMAI
jgi:desulfoferrodoxin (superoxide reductase-like protein)